MKFSRFAFYGLLVWLLAACSLPQSPFAPGATDPMGGDGMGPPDGSMTQEFAPLVGGIYNGDDLYFIHTEASDPDVASRLTSMMGGVQVTLVPQLAAAPPELLAPLYVFTNGVEGNGPFGFQKDIFDSVPGDPAYRPLRYLHLVEWRVGTTPRTLSSVAEVEAAQTAGEVTVTQPGIVANMPVLIWPGGSR
jgi:hypothetical protein